MAGFLVYRPNTDDKNKVHRIGAVLINGADAAAAIAAAVAYMTQHIGPLGAYANGWTALQLNASDFGSDSKGIIFRGDIVVPGTRMPGSGILLPIPA